MSESNDTNEQKTGGFMSRFTKRADKEYGEQIQALYGQDSRSEEDKPHSVVSPATRETSPQGRDMNVFTEGLTIEGNVTSETGIVIRGTVHGNVACRADVEISGQITGDVEGKNVRITGGGVQGNITAGEMLSVDRSRIKGNLSAMHARINNPIEGDIAVRGTLTLQREANIRGDITAAGLSVEEGASMNGRITISRERPEGSYAPQTSRSASAAPKRPVAKVTPSPKTVSSPGIALSSESDVSADITVSTVGKAAQEKTEADKQAALTASDKLFTAES